MRRESMTTTDALIPNNYKSPHAAFIRELCKHLLELIEGEGLPAHLLVDLAQFCTTEPITKALVEGLGELEGEASGTAESPWLLADCRQLAAEVMRARVALWIFSRYFDGDARRIIEEAVAEFDAIMEPLADVFAFTPWPFWQILVASGAPFEEGSSWWADAYHAARRDHEGNSPRVLN